MAKGVDLIREPFLEPGQEAALGILESELTMEPTVDFAATSLEGYGIVSRIAPASLNALTAIPRIKGIELSDFDSLTGYLQDLSVINLTRDGLLQVSSRLVAAATGGARAVGGDLDMQVVHGHDLGYTLIRKRAQHLAATWLCSSSAVLDLKLPHEEASLWELATATFERSRNKPPVAINAEEAHTYAELLQTVTDWSDSHRDSGAGIKPGKTKFVNGFRIARKVAKEAWKLRDSDLSPIEQVRSLIEEPISQAVPDFSDDQIEAGLRTPNRIRRYIQRAAEIEPAIANDPRARFLVFLGGRLATASTLKPDTVQFDRMVQMCSDLVAAQTLLHDESDQAIGELNSAFSEVEKE